MEAFHFELDCCGDDELGKAIYVLFSSTRSIILCAWFLACMIVRVFDPRCFLSVINPKAALHAGH